jgi:hypothetical protein
MKNPKHANAWVISVNMGYGHARAAYALKDLAHEHIIDANDYPGIPKRDKMLWGQSRKLYEAISRLKPLPLIGDLAFELLDRNQRIAPFYPKRDLSAPTAQVKQTFFMITKLGLCKHLIERLAQKPLPLVCTFFIPAFAAEFYDYPGDIYLTVCDADMSRAWVSMDPKKSRIKYFAPNGRVAERLRLYGVREENIFLTGFPLPKEIVGGPEGEMVKADLKTRICNLDPHGVFTKKYQRTLNAELGINHCNPQSDRPLTLTFSVGGAGAQRNLAIQMVQSLKHKLGRGMLHLHLAAGTKKSTADYFTEKIRDMGLKKALDRNLFVDYFSDRPTYFHEFTKLLRRTDILWTKPSEMSFYTGAGIPIIMAPSIGSQEVFNRVWLKQVGGGITQGDPRYTDEWLFDWVESGGLARMAWNGYIEAPTHGAYRIESIVTGEEVALAKVPMIV